MRFRFGMMFIFFAGVLLFTGFKDSMASFKNPIDLYAEDTDVTKINDTQLINAEIYAVMDCFVEEETTTKNKSGAITGKRSDFYYIVPAFNEDDTYYIGIKVPESKKSKYDKISDNTYNYLAGYTNDFGDDVVNVTGRLAKLDDKKYAYLREWFEESDWTEEEIDQYVLPVYIKTFDPATARILFFVSIALLFAGAGLLFWSHSASRKAKMKAAQQTY